jgi:hypothetical protein
VKPWGNSRFKLDAEHTHYRILLGCELATREKREKYPFIERNPGVSYAPLICIRLLTINDCNRTGNSAISMAAPVSNARLLYKGHTRCDGKTDE